MSLPQIYCRPVFDISTFPLKITNLSALRDCCKPCYDLSHFFHVATKWSQQNAFTLSEVQSNAANKHTQKLSFTFSEMHANAANKYSK